MVHWIAQELHHYGNLDVRRVHIKLEGDEIGRRSYALDHLQRRARVLDVGGDGYVEEVVQRLEPVRHVPPEVRRLQQSQFPAEDVIELDMALRGVAR